MTAQEFSNQFDVLYNNITSNQAPGLNEYEKTVFLTKAQDEIVKNYFSPKGNIKQDGFDDSIKRQADFASLIRTAALTKITDTGRVKLDPRSTLFAYRNDIFLVLNETLFNVDYPEKNYTIVPLSYAEYTRLMQKPYKYPPKNQAWRLITSMGSSPSDYLETGEDSYVEIIGRFGTAMDDSDLDYYVRYVKRPYPIILTDFTDTGLTIHGKSKPLGATKNPATEECCELSEHLHEEILQRAVELAKVAWTATGQENTQLVLEAGKRSE